MLTGLQLVELGHVVENVAEAAHAELRQLAEALPGRPDEERCAAGGIDCCNSSLSYPAAALTPAARCGSQEARAAAGAARRAAAPVAAARRRAVEQQGARGGRVPRRDARRGGPRGGVPRCRRPAGVPARGADGCRGAGVRRRHRAAHPGDGCGSRAGGGGEGQGRAGVACLPSTLLAEERLSLPLSQGTWKGGR